MWSCCICIASRVHITAVLAIVDGGLGNSFSCVFADYCTLTVYFSVIATASWQGQAVRVAACLSSLFRLRVNTRPGNIQYQLVSVHLH